MLPKAHEESRAEQDAHFRRRHFSLPNSAHHKINKHDKKSFMNFFSVMKYPQFFSKKKEIAIALC
jgi:hypothetical protein